MLQCIFQLKGKDDRRTILLAGKKKREPWIRIMVSDISFVLVLAYTLYMVA
jgi:hypothetical protein